MGLLRAPRPGNVPNSARPISATRASPRAPNTSRSGDRSPWTMPARCAVWSAPATTTPICRARSTSRGPWDLRMESTVSAGIRSVTTQGRPSRAWPQSWVVSTLGGAPRRWAVVAAPSNRLREAASAAREPSALCPACCALRRQSRASRPPSRAGDADRLAVLDAAHLVLRQDVPDVADGVGPMLEQLGRARRARELGVPLHQPPHLLERGRVRPHGVDQVGVEPRDEPFVVAVEHERRAAGHAGAEVPPYRPGHHDRAAGHVLAAVVPGALDDRDGARVADAEALSHATGDVELAAGGAVQARVPSQDRQLGGVVGGRPGDHDPAAPPLAHVVVGLAGE